MTSSRDGTAPCRRRITSAITPVHPVWCEAPRPAALSPWKYSLNSRLSFHSGSCCSRSTQPKQGRRPSAPTTKIEMSRSWRSVVMASEGELFPGPGRVLQRQIVAEEPVVPAQHLDQQVVEREPQRAAPVGVAAEHRRGGLGRLVVDRGHLAFHVQHVGMVAVVGRQGPQPVRGQELALVEQGRRELFQLAEADEAEQQPLVAGFAAHHALLGERGRVVDALPAQEVRELLAQPQRVVEHPLVDDRRGQHRDDADHGPDLHRDGGAVRGEQLVVEEAVAFVPHVLVVDRVGDVREMLKELERDVAGRGAGRTGTARSRCVAMLIA